MRIGVEGPLHCDLDGHFIEVDPISFVQSIARKMTNGELSATLRCLQRELDTRPKEMVTDEERAMDVMSAIRSIRMRFGVGLIEAKRIWDNRDR
jgi:hypothetical protein